MAQMASQPEMQAIQVCPLGREDLLEKEMATHSSILAWRIPWRGEPGGLNSPQGRKESDTLKDWAAPSKAVWAEPEQMWCERPSGSTLRGRSMLSGVQVHRCVLKLSEPWESPLDATDTFSESLCFIHSLVCFNNILASLVVWIFPLSILMNYNQSWQNQEAGEVMKPAVSRTWNCLLMGLQFHFLKVHTCHMGSEYNMSQE